MSAAEFLVDRSNINKTEFSNTCEAADRSLDDGEARMRIERFAFTANNVTYAAFGDAMKYWNFFPAKEGYGTVPVWGFAEIVESNADGVAVGDRFYGYYPMSSHLIVSPAKADAGGFFDSKAHRAELSPVYNYYVKTGGDPAYVPALEEVQMLFRPLFMTSFLIDDFLADNDFFGGTQVLISSASSKTGFGLAFNVARRDDVKAIGLTSPGNIDFTKSLGFYDEVITYDEINSLDSSIPTVFVDMAGNGDVRATIHSHFDDMLKYSCSVGASHWDQMGNNSDLKGPKPQLFFAPAQVQKRTQELGNAGFQAMVGRGWQSFVNEGKDLLDVVEESGADAIKRVYDETVKGSVPPKIGYILKF